MNGGRDMENNYMSSDSLIELEFLSDRRIGIHYHENIELLFLISGELSVTVEEDTFQLDSGILDTKGEM